MGQTVLQAVMDAEDMTLVGGVDPAYPDTLLSELQQGAPDEPVAMDVEEGIKKWEPDVMVDFTAPSALMHNLPAALRNGVACVVGTTGFSDKLIEEMCELCNKCSTPAVVAPNFSIGANLMMKFAAEAAALMDYAAIVEAHHENKLDAPSGTAMATAQRMREARGEDFEHQTTEHFGLDGVRGGEHGGISVQSIRMAGVVANQTVTLGGHRFDFRVGDGIHTENSYKWSVDAFVRLAEDAGWSRRSVWTDQRGYFSTMAFERIAEDAGDQ